MQLTLLIAALLGCQAAAAPPVDQIRQELDSYGGKHLNGFLYVEQDGRELFFHAVGFQDREAKRPITRESGVEIGSIVKPMSHIALLRLAKAGRLSYSDPISKYFPQAPADKAAITLRQLAAHTSGFKDVFGGDYQPMERDKLMELMLGSTLEFAPGSKQQYSNSGYSMLAAIMEKVTGKPFEEVVAKEVFQPIGLTRTGYLKPKWKPTELLVGYRRDGSRWGTPLDHFWLKDGPSWNLRGNGGMFSTMKELARWARAAHNGELLDSESYRTFAPRLAGPSVKPDTLWAVAGGNGIFDTVVGYNPHRKLVFVAASTDARFQIEDVLRGLIPRILALGSPK